MNGSKLVSVASVLLTVPMYVKRIPVLGTSTSAKAGQSGIGEAADVMLAVAKQGQEVVNLSCLGTGPNSSLCRRIFQEAGIKTVTSEVVGDIGMKMVLIQDSGFYTSVLSAGVEVDISVEELSRLTVNIGDVIYISAGDLAYDTYWEAISQWIPTLPEEVTVVMAATPLIQEASAERVSQIFPWVDILSCSKSEGRYLPCADGELDSEYVRKYMRKGAAIVERDSCRGARIITACTDQLVPTIKIEVVDTQGVGSAHCGVMIAGLLEGRPLTEAVKRGNVAGALAATVSGNHHDVAPGAEQIEARIKELN